MGRTVTTPVRQRSPIATLLGALLYGRRPEDEVARKKTRKIAGSMSAAGLVGYLLLEMWGVTKASIYEEREQHGVQIATVVAAIDRQATAIDRLAGVLQESVEEQKTVNAVLLDRISGPLPPRSIPAPRTVRPKP